jgi:hypothetical protein
MAKAKIRVERARSQRLKCVPFLLHSQRGEEYLFAKRPRKRGIPHFADSDRNDEGCVFPQTVKRHRRLNSRYCFDGTSAGFFS